MYIIINCIISEFSVMSHVAEPVRFVIETKARILPQNERYWYYAKKSLVKQFNVRVKRRDDNKDFFDVVGIDKSEEIELNRSKMSLTLQLANLTASTWSSLKSPPSSSTTIGDDPDRYVKLFHEKIPYLGCIQNSHDRRNFLNI